MSILGENLGAHLERSGPLCVKSFARVAARILCAVGELHARGRVLEIIDPREIVLHPCVSRVESAYLLRGPRAQRSDDLSPDIVAIGNLFELMLYGRYTAPYGFSHDLLDLIGRCTGARRGHRPDSAAEILEQLIDVIPASVLVPGPRPADAAASAAASASPRRRGVMAQKLDNPGPHPAAARCPGPTAPRT